MDYLEEELLRISREKAYNPLSNEEISRKDLPERDERINQIIQQPSVISNKILQGILNETLRTEKD